MKSKLSENSNSGVIALSVSPEADDQLALQSVFQPLKWMLFQADGLPSALRVLHKHEVGVVLCERDLPHANWRDMLEHLILLDDAPPLIVTSRLADEQLWAEALNLGAYDVLAKPFDTQELTRTTHLAWLHWYHHPAIRSRTALKTFVAGRN